jgi:hypothetical protein
MVPPVIRARALREFLSPRVGAKHDATSTKLPENDSALAEGSFLICLGARRRFQEKIENRSAGVSMIPAEFLRAGPVMICSTPCASSGLFLYLHVSR